MDILNRGLTFIPTIHIHKNLKFQLEKDIQTYHRRLSLIIHFKDSNKIDKTPFIPKSDWTPPPHLIPLEIHNLFAEDLKTIKKSCKVRSEKHNLLPEEVRAIKELKNNQNIIIKQADKGSAVVVQSRDQYIREANRQLNNDKHYKKLDKPIYPETIPMIKNITTKLHEKGFINKKQKQYLDGDGNVRERRFYTLPKIHKDPEKWDPPFEIPPGRPIVSDCNSESYYTAEFIEHFLHPLSILHPSYVRDTYHFIDIIKKLKIPQNSYFFTIDIDSLYTNINTESGLKAVKNTFLKYPNKKRPDKELLQLLTINLTRNDFVFNSQFYLQISGTAMGKKFAPSYANIFMAEWEAGALERCPKKPLHYWRYLDDIFGVWTHSLAEFQQFISVLNSHDLSIKTKSSIHESSIDFLDTSVYKGPTFLLDQQLHIKVFFKKTDTHSLLHKTSFHPKHTYGGLIRSQLLRFDRICTQKDNFWKATTTLFHVLRKRGYSRTFLRKCLKNFKNTKTKDHKEIIPFITTFSSSSIRANKIIKNNFEQLNISKFIPNHKLIMAQRKNPNLADLLVRAKLSPINNKKPIKKHPDYFHHLEFVRNQLNKNIFHIPHKFPPQTKNSVYLIFCKKCHKQYVGETSNEITKRMWQHKYNILNRKELHTPLVIHFVQHGWTALRIMVLQHNPSWTEAERKKMERRWIYLLNSREPIGLNQRWFS